MSKPAGIDLGAGDAALGALAVRGPDAARFLQGQLSADIEKLEIGKSTITGLHNPQGRVIAVMTLARPAAEELFAVLPAELVQDVMNRLRKYILRAKVRIEDLSATTRIIGCSNPPTDACATIEWGGRWIALTDVGGEPAAGELDRAAWEALDVRAGIPLVYTSTRETFVSQMLNLDLLGAIAFDKGCYTGQEVIARAHYRGRVKRRMQRWRAAGDVPLRPGDAARGPDGRALVIVRAAASPSGNQEVLAVGNYSAAIDDAPASAGEDAAVPLLEGPLPLPYSLPE
jgi:folate-binding protein YgfZ